MWRCFFRTRKDLDLNTVFSTYVEMFLIHAEHYRVIMSFLHVCGDVSSGAYQSYLDCMFSPRIWRCFRQKVQEWTKVQVFSTYVEMFLKLFINLSSLLKFSPRMWRCFLVLCKEEGLWSVFSTYVEMFLMWSCPISYPSGFLHVCGDVSPSHHP